MTEKTRTAVIGGSVTLPCRTPLETPVDWQHESSTNEGVKFVCVAGTIVNGYTTRFALERSFPDDFSLVITNVSYKDAGVYMCIEDAGLGVKHRITLDVKGKTGIYTESFT